METTVKFYSLDYKMAKTYWFAILFIAGNIVLPQLCHLIPGGGPMLLPIYFFTLIAAYKYGLTVGLLTAFFSPLINSVLFGMPLVAALPVILVKSGLLALTAGLLACYARKLTLLVALVLTVLIYQIAGTAFEWFVVKNLWIAAQDFRIGLPGMFIQVLGGYAVLRVLAKY